MTAEGSWDEAHWKHLLWYATTQPRPKGELEQKYGAAFEPGALCNIPAREAIHPAWNNYLSGRPSDLMQREGGPSDEAVEEAVEETVAEANIVNLDMLIEYLVKEVEEKELKERADAAAVVAAARRSENGSDVTLGGTLARAGLQGQLALDTYVAELVSSIRDFPYLNLRGGREAGKWVRDEIVAPCFEGYWDFYANRKEGEDMSLLDLYTLLCGEGMLLERLRYARDQSACDGYREHSGNPQQA
eukprot:TRINITY_DN18952_c0_g1_i1.p1 TRINITY_DN18952_c0_g1~~TRINITY_DN18952_c0_g1_i1.p1  ORF type:complete len:245 (-),score=46.12 TRINITY_DN18952_c0_g1_i1:130-864(-)